MAQKKTPLYYRWVILVVCFLMEFLCLGFCSSNMGLYTVPVTEALHIDRAAYSLAGSIRYITQVLVALYFGTCVNKFGIKKMVSVGLISLIGATVVRGVATNVWHIYLAGALHGLGIVFVGGTMAGTIVRRWFHQDVGRYTGIVMSANGIGGAIAAQIISPIINNGETFGYRNAYFLSAVIALAIGVVIMVFLKDQATDEPIVAGNKKKKAQGTAWTGMEYTVARKKVYFYVAAVLVFLTGISLQSIGSITIVYMTDLGIDPGFIATTATVSSLALTVSKLSVGIVYDKKGLRISLLICQLCGLGTFVLKGLLTNTTLGLVMAMTATVLSVFALPLETVMITLLTNDLFGSASYNKVLGIFMAMNSLGLCLGSPLGELIRKALGDYRPCFWLFGAIFLIVIISFQFVIRAAYKDKDAILAAETA